VRLSSTTIYRMTLSAAALAAVAVTAVMGMTTRGWIGTTFPGFFVLSNRVVASVGRPDWSASADGRLYQGAIVAVEDRRIYGNAEIYDAAAHLPAGAEITYTLRRGGTMERVRVETRRFSRSDYWIIFGSYLATGVLYLLVGLLGAWMVTDARLSRAILLLGSTGGIYALSGAGIYASNSDLRLHVMGEAFLPATLIYLAAACTRRHEWLAAPVVAVAVWISGALALAYQMVLNQPDAYSLVHATGETYIGVAGLACGVMLLVAHRGAAPEAGPLLSSTLVGVLLGLGMPAVIMVMSGLGGGRLPVNLCTATAFMLPLCMGVGIVRERLAWRGDAIAQVA
jgi:hypothetical protein